MSRNGRLDCGRSRIVGGPDAVVSFSSTLAAFELVRPGNLPAANVDGTVLDAEGSDYGPTHRNSRDSIDIPITRQPQYTGGP
jgi:hypothetical protein